MTRRSLYSLVLAAGLLGALIATGAPAQTPKRGGVLNVVRHDLELVCDASVIPDEIHIDLAGLDVGDSVHISAIALPKGVESAITDRDFTIATLVAPSALKSEEGDTQTDTAEAAEEPAAEGGDDA